MPKLGYGYKHCMSLLQLMIYELHMILLKYITIYHTLFADSLICQKGLSKYYVIIECSTTVGRVPLQIYSDCCLMPTQLFLYPTPRRGRGVYCFTSVRLSFRPSKIFFVAYFSVTVDGRNLIFGHKCHIGIP
jgi:hypothetical protein